MITTVEGNTIFLQIDEEIYNEDVIHKCFYWYSGRYVINIDKLPGKIFRISILIPIEECGEKKVSQLIHTITRDLIDFKLRDIVTKETKTIRELIVAKAFAYYDTDNEPETSITDPVGFNPEQI
jgi:His-Xaa-Ser system protein HxsD